MVSTYDRIYRTYRAPTSCSLNFDSSPFHRLGGGAWISSDSRRCVVQPAMAVDAGGVQIPTAIQFCRDVTFQTFLRGSMREKINSPRVARRH